MLDCFIRINPLGAINKKRHFECFLCRASEQKMYRESFLNENFLFSIRFFSKITRIDENFHSKTDCTQRVRIAFFCTFNR